MYAFSPLFCKWKVFFRISTYEHVQARSFLKYAILDVPNIHEIQKLERVLQRSVLKKSRREGSPSPTALIPKEIEYQVATRRKHLHGKGIERR